MTRLALRRLAARRSTVVAAAVFALFLAYTLLFPLVSRHGPNDTDLERSRLSPSSEHLLGTDLLGRDLLTRLAAGGQTTLAITGLSLAIILVVGLLWGTTAALAGGRVDALMMRIVDGLFAIPRLPVAIVILVVLSLNAANIPTIAFALSVTGWMLTARLVRGHVLTLKTREYVVAARAIGATWPQVARKHIVPNSIGILLVALLLEVPTLVLGEAFISVLGLGPPPPTPTWGTMANLGWQYGRLWDMVLATAAITIFVATANVLADRVQEALDPRSG